jgi:hypothetical protein
MDYVVRFSPSKVVNTTIFVGVEVFPKFVWLFATTEASTSATQKDLKKKAFLKFCVYNATPFIYRKFKQFCF